MLKHTTQDPMPENKHRVDSYVFIVISVILLCSLSYCSLCSSESCDRHTER